MVSRRVKSLLVAAFSLSCLFIPAGGFAQGETPKAGQEDSAGATPSQDAAKPKEEKKLDASKLILEHVMDAHEFHILTLGKNPVSIPLPVILYSPASGKGLTAFMSSAFDHGRQPYNGYMLLEEQFIQEHGLDEKVFKAGNIYALDAKGMPDPTVTVYDFSLTRNVMQMLISVILLIVVMTRIAGKYAKGEGVGKAPTGFQNAMEPIILFVRDEVGKANLGDRYEKYMPYLLTVFFFILFNSLLSLVPGTANVAGNIAFTAVLGIISFIIILFSSNKHYWGHIINPPVPIGVNLIMIPVEIMGLFTKPFALIVRLFANMISGHIIILSFIFLIFVFGAMNTGLGWGTSPFFILMAVFIYAIEILVAFIQAYIFANLTAVFIGQAFEGSHHGDKEGHGVGEHDHGDAVIL
jgi:F-type H+-transporting ATPase subunit a